MGSFKKYYFGKKKLVFNLNTQLIAYYGFNSDLIDSINGNNGTNSGCTFNTGKNGNKLKFTFATRASIPQSTNLDFSDGINDIPFSMAFWIQKDDTIVYEAFNKCNNTATGNQWRIIQTNGIIEIILYDNGNTISAKYTTAGFGSGVLAHVVITYDGSGVNTGIKMYNNGVLKSLTYGGSGVYTKMNIASQISRINSFNGANSGYGGLDELAIWKNRVLTASEVSYLYNSGTGRFYPF